MQMPESLVVSGVEYVRKDCIPEPEREKEIPTSTFSKALSLAETSELWRVGSTTRTSRILRELDKMGHTAGFRIGKPWRVDPEKAWEKFQDGTVERVIEYLREKGRWA